MNATASAPAAAPRRLTFWSIVLRLLLVAAITGTALLALLLYTFLPRGDVRALRRLAADAAGVPVDRKIELRVGEPAIGLAQLILPFTPAPAEANEALAAVHSAEVSVNELRGTMNAGERRDFLAAARTRMAERGWEVLVSVLEDDQTVAVFTRPEDDGDQIRLCVLVVDGHDLVIAKCDVDARPLARLAAAQIPPLELAAR